MKKLLTIVKREYLTRVKSKAFILSTILGPLIMTAFMAAPVLIAMMETGEAMRLAVVDQTGRMFDRVRESINQATDGEPEAPSGAGLGSLGQNLEERARQAGIGRDEDFVIEKIEVVGRSLEDIKSELNERVRRKDLDGYLLIPPDVLLGRRAEYYGRYVGDFITSVQIEEALSRAVNEQRLADAGVDAETVREMQKGVSLNTFKITEKTEKKDSGEGFFTVLGVGFLVFIMILIYGGTVLSAVIEEKETRIAEVLFSSANAFPLVLGKLIGVSLVALTQIGIWAMLLGGFTIYGAAALKTQNIDVQLPRVPPSAILYFVVFFLLGFFLYSSLYAVIGAVVRTQEESQGFVIAAIAPLILSFYLTFPVMRNPDSSMAFWASVFPLSAAVVMPVRIVSQAPPFWQIALSLFTGIGAVVLVTWVAARIYRMGMLMYGKRATIPEIWRWVRES